MPPAPVELSCHTIDATLPVTTHPAVWGRAGRNSRVGDDSRPAGTESPLRDVIVGCCNLVGDDSRYLLVKEAKPSARSRFNLPAGKPEIGETLPQAAVREAKEETGLDVVVDHLVGLYQCPRTSEGFGVVNFVFASRVTGGTIKTTRAHPEVRWFTKHEIAALSSDGMLRGSHIQLAIEAYERGEQLPLEVVQVVSASPFATGTS